MTTELKNKIRNHLLSTLEDPKDASICFTDNQIIIDFNLTVLELNHLLNMIDCKDIMISTEHDCLTLTIFN